MTTLQNVIEAPIKELGLRKDEASKERPSRCAPQNERTQKFLRAFTDAV